MKHFNNEMTKRFVSTKNQLSTQISATVNTTVFVEENQTTYKLTSSTISVDNTRVLSSFMDTSLRWIGVDGEDDYYKQTLGAPNVFVPSSGVFIGNILSGILTTQSSIANTQRIAPFLVNKDTTIDQIGFSVSTALAGNAQILIFESDDLGRPSTSILQSTNLATNTTGLKLYTIGTPITFKAGKLYWLGLWTSNNVTVRCAQTYANYTVSWTNASTPARQSCLQRTLAFGGVNTNWSYTSSDHRSSNSPFFLLRVA